MSQLLLHLEERAGGQPLRGRHRVPASGHIAASDAVDRKVLVAQGDPRQGLDLHLTKGILLDSGEDTDLCLRKLDVLVGESSPVQ